MPAQEQRSAPRPRPLPFLAPIADVSHGFPYQRSMLALSTRSARPGMLGGFGTARTCFRITSVHQKASCGPQLPYTGYMSPHAVITDVVFEAFLQCEMKAYLLLQGVTGTDPEIADWQWTVAHQFQKSCSERLRLAAPEAQCHTGMPPLDALEQGFYRVILDPLISASDIHAQLHALVRVVTRRGVNAVSYFPVRFVPHEKLAPSDKLLVAFDALAVSR